MSTTNDQIAKYYQALYEQQLEELCNGGMKLDKAELMAQKHAIKETALHFFTDPKFPNKASTWNFLYASHVARKAGILIEPATVEKVISADQSWKKSSGHAFEEMVKTLGNATLEGTGLSIVLQREVKALMDKGTLKNESRDLEWLKHQLDSDVFDLYIMKDFIIFGCIQAKTSVRDRVTRDREPSFLAMEHFFWSVIFVLDGKFLALPKFQHMVNGGGKEFTGNGWHSLYAFHLPIGAGNGRIKLLDNGLEIFKSDALEAAETWFGSGRQWMNRDWNSNIS
jgi:hypothetical protein